jgi:hypothetical protein
MSTQTPNEYLLLFRGTEWHKGLSPEELQKAMTEFKGWFDRLTEEGKLKGANPLMREGKLVSGKQGRVVADGPFAESKEAIGGYFLLQAQSLEEAVAIARACPTLEFGTVVEVRPVAEMCPLMESMQESLAAGELAQAGA